MDILASMLTAACVFLALLHRAGRRNRREEVLRLAGMEGDRRREEKKGKRYHAILWNLVERLGTPAPWRGGEREEELLREAGVEWTAVRYRGLRRLCGLAFCLSLLPLGLTAVPFLPLVFAAGNRIPPLYLRRRHRRALETLGSDLPEVVDLVAVLCYGGESLQRSLQCSLSICHNPRTRRELEGVLEGLRLGEGLGEALRRVADHPYRELRRLARTLSRAEESGAPVSEALSQMATEMRHARRERNRTRAARASVMVLFPLVFMILPSFLLLTVGSMIIGHAP